MLRDVRARRRRRAPVPRLRRGRLVRRGDRRAACSQPGRFAVVGRGDNAWDMVHVDDLATALRARGRVRAAPGEIYHCADDVPTTYCEAAGRAAAALGVGAPRRIPARGRAPRGRRRARSSRSTRSARTSNAKLKAELGWTPQFPDSRDGIPAVVAELG